jgi:hypothetical protein
MSCASSVRQRSTATNTSSVELVWLMSEAKFRSSAMRRSPMTRSVSSVTTQKRPAISPGPSPGAGLYENVW